MAIKSTTRKLLRPAPLEEGDTICLLSPAGIVDSVYTKATIDKLTSWGFNVVMSPHALGRSGRYSGTEQERLSDLHEAFSNPDIKAILCTRGGYGTIQLLEQLDRGIITKSPKWVVGYSDITALHALMQQAGIISIHGPMTRHIAECDEDDIAFESLITFLEGGELEYAVPSHPLNRTGKATGVLRGGNLAILQTLRGTPYDFDPSSTILFIEDVGERPYQIERMMYNLRLGGVFDSLKGLIVGSFTEYEPDPTMPSVEEIIRKAVDPYSFPVCFDFPVGHTMNNVPLLCGCKVLLTVDEDVWIVER